MPLPDASAGAQLSSGAFSPEWIGFLDFQGDPVRVTTARSSITFSGTGDPDLDGYTFSAIDPQFIGIGDIRSAEGGSDTVTVTLSGIVGPDTELLNVIGNRALWQTRVARLWAIIRNEAGVQQGAVWNFYTGRMSSVEIIGEPESQAVKLEIENYLASLKQASGRTYGAQGAYDPLDNTAALTIGAANGSTRGVATAWHPSPGGDMPDHWREMLP